MGLTIKALTSIIFISGVASLLLPDFASHAVLQPDIQAAASAPYTVATYMLVHSNWLHLLFNIMWMVWIATLPFCHLLRNSHTNLVFLAGGVAAAISFLTISSVFPDSPAMPLAGASGGVLALVSFIAVKFPRSPANIIMFPQIRIWHVAATLFALYFVGLWDAGLPSHTAHIAGMGAGIILGLTIRSQYKNDRKTTHEAIPEAVLEKLKQSGYAALDADEKTMLLNSSVSTRNKP